jgi:hypothetical protein
LIAGIAMIEFVVAVVSHTPLWVWALFSGLIALAISQLRERTIPRARVLILPMVLLGIGLFTSKRGGLALVVWAIALAAAFLFTAFVWQPASRAEYLPHLDRLKIPGSVTPLVLTVAIFFANYALQVAFALKPALRSELFWQVLPNVCFGVITGFFLARAATLFRMKNTAPLIA